MRLALANARVDEWRCSWAGISRAARWLAAIGMTASLLGCVLAQDIADPALDVPGAYRSAGAATQDTPPTLDWWRGFGSPELSALMEESQKVNLDLAAAQGNRVKRFVTKGWRAESVVVH